jgi:hypothetical protein
MRKLLILICVLGITHFSFAQNPVQWQFTSKKIKDKTYEVHITATIEEPWNIYSQSTPDGGPVPTKIAFARNPLIDPSGKIKEVGTLKKKFEDVFDVDVLYYKNKVDFVQVVTLKSKVKTNLTGSVEFMVCNDEECLPPSTVNFSIPIH